MTEFNRKNIDRARKTGEFKSEKVVPLFDWNDPFTLRELIARLQQQEKLAAKKILELSREVRRLNADKGRKYIV